MVFQSPTVFMLQRLRVKGWPPPRVFMVSHERQTDVLLGSHGFSTGMWYPNRTPKQLVNGCWFPFGMATIGFDPSLFGFFFAWRCVHIRLCWDGFHPICATDDPYIPAIWWRSFHTFHRLLTLDGINLTCFEPEKKHQKFFEWSDAQLHNGLWSDAFFQSEASNAAECSRIH